MKRLFGINPDIAGFWTSTLCAIHCSAVPLLIAFGALGSNTWLHNHAIDWTIIGIGICIATYSLYGDYKYGHKKSMPLMMAGVGFAMLVAGMMHHHGWVLFVSVAGGLLVASSHLVNHRMANHTASID